MNVLRTLPLSLTVVRVFLGPAFLLLHHRQADTLWLVLIVVVAILTDYLDGATARWWNAVSTAGKLLDPLADAFFCMMIFVDFALQGALAWWIVVILITREVFITFLLRPLALSRGTVMAAGMPGKVKTVLQFSAILVVLVMQWPVAAKWPAFMTFLTVIKPVVFLTVVALSVGSAAQYVWKVARNPRCPGAACRAPGDGTLNAEK